MKKAMPACGFIILFSSFIDAREDQITIAAQSAGSQVAIDIEDLNEIHRNKIYAVDLPDAGVTLKRVIRSGGYFMLFAANPSEPGFSICLAMKGLNYNPICGRMVWAWNNFLGGGIWADV